MEAPFIPGPQAEPRPADAKLSSVRGRVPLLLLLLRRSPKAKQDLSPPPMLAKGRACRSPSPGICVWSEGIGLSFPPRPAAAAAAANATVHPPAYFQASFLARVEV